MSTTKRNPCDSPPMCPNGCGPMVYYETQKTKTIYRCTGCPTRVAVGDDDYDDYDAADKMAEYLWEGTVDGEVYDGDPADLDFF